MTRKTVQEYRRVALKWRQKHQVTLGFGIYLYAGEKAWILARKKASGLSWLSLIYRGLGCKRSDYLEELELNKPVKESSLNGLESNLSQ